MRDRGRRGSVSNDEEATAGFGGSPQGRGRGRQGMLFDGHATCVGWPFLFSVTGLRDTSPRNPEATARDLALQRDFRRRRLSRGGLRTP